VDAPGHGALPAHELSLSPYIAALELWRRGAKAGVEFRGGTVTLVVSGATPHKPGPKPDLDHYENVLREFRELQADGPGAIKALARRYKVPVGTVKSWLYRARDYEDKGER
jgi:hypothetical protein